MADRELNLKVSASTRDASGQVRLFGRELRQLDREVDRTTGGMKSLSESLDRIERGQRQGVLSPGQASALRFRAQAQQFQERFGGAISALPGGGAVSGALGAAQAGGPLAIVLAGLSSTIGLLVEQMRRTQNLEERGLAVGRDPNEIRRFAAIANRLGIRPENVPVEAISRRAAISGESLTETFLDILESVRGLPAPQRARALEAQGGRGLAVLGGAVLESGLPREFFEGLRPIGGDIPRGRFTATRAAQAIRGSTGEAFDAGILNPVGLAGEAVRQLQEAMKAGVRDGTRERDMERAGDEPGGGVGVAF